MRLIIRRPRPLSKASTGALALPKLGAPTREWEQDGYRCRYFSRDDGMGVVTVDGPNMPLPWHEVADSEGKARALVKSAIPKLRAGKSPSAGVFKPLAKARPRKPPGQGRTARAATTAAPQPEAKPKGTRTRAPRKVDHAATARDALTASRVADDRYQAAVRETRRSDPRADISAHAGLQLEGRRQMHIHHAATHRHAAEQEPARARQHLEAADAHDRAGRAHLSGGDDATRASTSAAAYKASDAAHGRMTKARLMVKARRGEHNRLPTDVEKKDKRGRTYYGPPDKPKKQKPRGRPEVDPEAATVKLEEPKLHRHPWVAEHELRNRIREHVARHDRARSLADSAHAEGDHEEADHWDGVADEHHHAARLLQLAGQHRSRGRDVEAIEHLQAGLRQSRAANKAGVPMVKGRRLGVLLKGKKRAGQPGYTKSKDRRGRTIWVRESDTTSGPAKPQYPRPEHPPGSPPVPPGGVRPGLTDEEHADLGKHIPHMHERIAEHDTLSRYAFAQAEKAKTTTDRTAWTARAFEHQVAKGHLREAIRHHERRYGSTKERVPAALEASDAAMGDETKGAYEASLPQRAKRAALKVRDLGERVGKRVGLIKGRRLVVRLGKAKRAAVGERRKRKDGWYTKTAEGWKREKAAPAAGGLGERMADGGEEGAPAPKTPTREQRLALVYRFTHKDMKGRMADGRRSIMVGTGSGLRLMALEDMPDEELDRKMPVARAAEHLAQKQPRKARAPAKPREPLPVMPAPLVPAKAEDAWSAPEQPFAAPDEVSMSAATAAHAGTSWTPELRAEQERADYAAALNAHHDQLHGMARTPEEHAMADEHLTATKARFKASNAARLSARSRTTSWMITGRSGRNEARESKKSDAASRREAEHAEVLPNSVRSFTRKLKEHREAQAGGPLAMARHKVATLEALQARMKEANKIVQSKKMEQDEKIDAIVALGITEAQARSLFEPDFAGRVGFPGYVVNNNASEIRRMKARVADLEQRERVRDALKTETGQAQTKHEFTGSAEFPFKGEIEYDHEDGRIRLRFHERLPREKFQEIQRRTGFNWSRQHNAFSHALSDQGVMTARRITGADLPFLAKAHRTRLVVRRAA